MAATFRRPPLKFYTMQRDSNGWIDPAQHLPENLPGKDYSANVLALVKYEVFGQPRYFLAIMAYIWAHCEDLDNSGYVWANCCGNIDGEAEHDDDYNVIGWQPLPAEALGMPVPCPTCGEAPKATCKTECADTLARYVEGMPVPPAFTYKALEWRKDADSDVWQAHGCNETYSLIKRGAIFINYLDWGTFTTLQQAKDYCQAHHEGQLLKFLNPVS